MRIFLACALLLLYGCSGSEEINSPPGLIHRFETLYEAHNFFRLRTAYENNMERLSEPHRLLYGAILDHAFFRHHSSMLALDSLKTQYGKELTRSERLMMHRTRRTNFFNTYAYSDALSENRILTSEFRDLLDSTEYEDLVNDQKILEVIKNVPRQELVKHNDCLISLSRNSDGLTSANVEFGDHTSHLLFDTGFSMSSLKRSLAEKLGLKIIGTDSYVHGATGKKVNCSIAVAEKIKISEITVKHVVFYVFEDDDLSLPERNITLNGVIGFPVIRAMDEIHIKRNEMIFIPKTTLDYDLDNLAMYNLDPLVAITYRHDTLPFYLDTGSSFTALYRQYYEMYRDEIDALYERKKFMIGSIGGYRKIDCFKTDTNVFIVGGKSRELLYTPIFAEYIFPPHMRVAGVMGQDFLSGFDTMIISFSHASLVLE